VTLCCDLCKVKFAASFVALGKSWRLRGLLQLTTSWVQRFVKMGRACSSYSIPLFMTIANSGLGLHKLIMNTSLTDLVRVREQYGLWMYHCGGILVHNWYHEGDGCCSKNIIALSWCWMQSTCICNSHSFSSSSSSILCHCR
jgi:hypothetical protein